jgi:multiple sugar transport system substrate-binding protein
VTPTTEEVARKQAERFNAAHPDGPTVKLRVMPEDTGQYFGQLRTQFQAGGNEIAVITGDVIWPPQLAEPGWIADLSDRFTTQLQAAFLPGTVAAMQYQDRIWGVPWFTDSGLLYYRQDLLEDAGFDAPPATWEELKEMAARIQADAGTKHGFVFTGAIYEGGTVLGTEFIRGAGGDILDGDEVVIARPEAVRGLTVQQSLVADGIAPEAVGNFKEDEATGAFLRGDAVFMRMWPYAYDLLSDPEQSELETAQVGLAHVPVADAGVTPVNVGGGWNFYVNASAGDQDGAWALIEFMTAAEQQKEMALEASLLPTRKGVYDDPEVLEQLPAVALGKDAILQTTTPPVSPYYADMSEAMAKQFNANLLGSVTPQEAAETLQEELAGIVERGG